MTNKSVFIEKNGIEYEIPVNYYELEQDKYELGWLIADKNPSNEKEFLKAYSSSKIYITKRRLKCGYNI